MKKYRWIKIKDTCGDTYEFEDCVMYTFMGRITVFYVAPIGTVRKIFFTQNIISLEYLGDDDVEVDE